MLCKVATARNDCVRAYFKTLRPVFAYASLLIEE